MDESLTTQIVEKSVMAETLGFSVAATREDGCVASIMRNMSWGAPARPSPSAPPATWIKYYVNSSMLTYYYLRHILSTLLAGPSPAAQIFCDGG